MNIVWMSLLALAFQQTSAQKWKTNNFTICASPLPPMAECQPGSDPEGFTGHDIEQVRYVTRLMGWTSANYSIVCLAAFDDIINDLTATDGGMCDIAAAGITRSMERERMGIQFTYPTYRASLGVMVRANVREGSHWGFLRPLHWSVWIATPLTALTVALMVFVIESIACHGFVHRADWVQGLKNATWDSFISLVNFGHFEVHSTAARFVVMGYGFLVLIIINTYVANLAAFLTITQVDTSATQIEDLYGEGVATVAVYEEQLKSQGITPVIVEQDGRAQEALLESLRTKRYKAVLMDEPWVTHTVSSGLNCDLQALSDTLVHFDYAFGLPRRAPQDFVDQLSKILLQMQEDLVSEELVERFIRFPSSGCPKDNEISDTRAVKFHQVLGLWVILAGCIAFAFIILVGNLFRHIPGAINARALEGRSFRQGLSMGRMNPIPTRYTPKASAQLRKSSCQCKDLRLQLSEVYEAVSSLAAEVQRMGGPVVPICASVAVEPNSQRSVPTGSPLAPFDGSSSPACSPTMDTSNAASVADVAHVRNENGHSVG